MLLNFRRSSKLVFLVLLGLFENNILLAPTQEVHNTLIKQQQNSLPMQEEIGQYIIELNDHLKSIQEANKELDAINQNLRKELDIANRDAAGLAKREAEILPKLQRIDEENAKLKNALERTEQMYKDLADATNQTFTGLTKVMAMIPTR